MSKATLINSRWITLLFGVLVCLSVSAQEKRGLQKVAAPKRAVLKELKVDSTKQSGGEELIRPMELKEASQQMKLSPVSDRAEIEPTPLVTTSAKKTSEFGQDSIASRVRNRRDVETKPMAFRDTLSAPTDTTRERYVYLLHADETRYNRRINPDAQILVGDVVFRHDSMYMYCDSALFYENSNSLDAYGNVRMHQGDTLHLYGDRLHYNGDEMLAKVRENVVMIDKQMTLTTDSLNYDRTINLGYYFNWGTVEDTLNVLTSEWGEYDTQTNEAIFNY